jgi:hypothetical protein
LVLLLHIAPAAGFSNPSPRQQPQLLPQAADVTALSESEAESSRRSWFFRACSNTLSIANAAAATTAATTAPAFAAEEETQKKMFAPGGTLVDYQVGVTVGNDKASVSRKFDNSNVIFGQDYYYKFGTAPRFIPKGDTSFPVTMPFVLSQQRYDTLKKYRERVQRGIDAFASIKSEYIEAGNYAGVPDADNPLYSIRPLGLLANGFLASENTGTTNELFLARWYINEIYLDIDDIRKAGSKVAAEESYANLVLALNSYLGMLNRSITSKVGDPFELL